MTIGRDQASNMMEASRLAEMMAPAAPRSLKDLLQGRQYVDDLYDEKPPVRKAVEALTKKLASTVGAKTLGPSLAQVGSAFGPFGTAAGLLAGSYAGGLLGDMMNTGWDASGIQPAQRSPDEVRGALPAAPAPAPSAPAQAGTLYGAMPYTGYGALSPYGMV
jgi:phage tail tape-measure protein